jgi:hypothetical protein
LNLRNLSSPQSGINWALERFVDRDCEGAVELAVLIVVLVVAGAMIPGDPRIVYFR